MVPITARPLFVLPRRFVPGYASAWQHRRSFPVTHVSMEVQMAKRVAMLFGVVFVLVGVLGFVTTGGMQMGDVANPPKLLGLFPVNVLHNLVHLLFGVWGILAARSFAGAQAYCKIGGVVYLVLAGLAFITPTTFGLIPIGGNDIWLHALLGVVLAGVGFTATEESAEARATA